MTAILLPIGIALLVAVQARDYGVPYYPAPHYFEHQQPYDLPCPPSGPESLVCAGAPGAQPSTFPSPCEVQRFRALTGISEYCPRVHQPPISHSPSQTLCLSLQTGRSSMRIGAKLSKSARITVRISTIPFAESTRMPGETSGVNASCSWSSAAQDIVSISGQIKIDSLDHITQK